MIAGGAEAIINPLGITAFNALKALSTRNDPPQKASRPFDRDRDGFVISEGAVVLILESLEHALKRGANIMAEIVGYGATADSFHVTQPLESGEGAAKAMQMALKRGGIDPEEIDYINAHGTSTQLNDAMETKAIKTVFGDYAYKVPDKLHEVDDRTPYRLRRRRRTGYLHHDDSEGNHTADDKLR